MDHAVHAGGDLADTANQRILIVDDDVELASMLRQYLLGEGFHVDAVHDGEDGIAAAMTGYDAVILDVMLPRLSGTDVLRHIRKFSDVPVIMLTAKGDNVERAVGLELGADDYIAKPYFPRELVARLRAVLRRNSAGESVTGNVLQAGGIQVDMKARQASIAGRSPFTLT